MKICGIVFTDFKGDGENVVVLSVIADKQVNVSP